MLDDTPRARLVAQDLRGERIERLERLKRLKRSMLEDDRQQYWELSELGVNFNYLQVERRTYLEPLFDLIRQPD